MACALGLSPGRCASQPVRRGVILVGLDALRLNWRRGDAERAFLSTFGEPAALEEQDKHYVIARDTGTTEKNGLSMHLPLTLAPSDAPSVLPGRPRPPPRAPVHSRAPPRPPGHRPA